MFIPRIVTQAHRADAEISSEGGAIFSFPCGCDAEGGHAEGSVPEARRLTREGLSGPHYITHVG